MLARRHATTQTSSMYVVEGNSLCHAADTRLVLYMFSTLVESSGLEILRSTQLQVKYPACFLVSDMSDGAKTFHRLGCCRAEIRECIMIAT